MSLARSTRLGPYEILAPIGAGGWVRCTARAIRGSIAEVAIKVFARASCQRSSGARAFRKRGQGRGCALASPYSGYLRRGRGPRRDLRGHELLEGETLRSHLGRYALFNTSINGAGACLVVFDAASASFYLNNDAGSALQGPLTPGGTGSVSNSQCTLTGAGSPVSGLGNTLTVMMQLSFSGTFHGGKSI